MSRLSIAGLLVASVLVVGAPLALDRIGEDPASASNASPGGNEAAPPSGDGGPTSSPPTTDPRPRDDRRIVPESIPARGTIIEPAQPVPPQPPDAPFATVGEEAGAPVRWDSCTPIRYVVRRQGGPPNGFEMVQEALQRTSDASGLRFQFEGFTDELLDDWQAGPGAAGAADVWIGWAFDDEVPRLGPQQEDSYVAGVGGPGWQSGSPRILRGSAVLRADTTLDHRFGAGQTYGNVLLHEIGHMVGLDHSDSTADIMYESTSPDTPESWGPGDLAGLYALGSSQPCF